MFGTEAAAVEYFKDNDGKLASLFPPGGWAAPTASIVDIRGTGLGLRLAAERRGYMTVDAKDSDLFAAVRNLPVLGSAPIRKPVRAPRPPRFAAAL
ncbi:MAG: hypothetical protein KGI37_03760 [Alphaproteobacteria bacterium]|nr:hypothetical protein [Alphaproteobacteria bacterium]